MAENLALAALYAIRDVGLDPPAPDQLAERVRLRLAGELARERAAGRPTRGRRRWRQAGSLVVVFSTLVTVAVVVGLFALLHDRGDGGSSSAASARPLIARLAVLRRPQTVADVLPSRPKLVHLQGTIIPSLTRLVASPPGAKMYLVVSTPPTGLNALWDPKLGDQVSIVTITAHSATDSEPLPVADLSDAQQVSLSPGGRVPTPPGSRFHGRLQPAYEVSVVPDGVAHVRWTFLSPPGKPRQRVNARVGDNVAYARSAPTGGILISGRWYATDGTLIPTSSRPMRQAEAAQQTARKAAAIRQYVHYSTVRPHHCSPPSRCSRSPAAPRCTPPPASRSRGRPCRRCHSRLSTSPTHDSRPSLTPARSDRSPSRQGRLSGSSPARKACASPRPARRSRPGSEAAAGRAARLTSPAPSRAAPGCQAAEPAGHTRPTRCYRSPGQR